MKKRWENFLQLVLGKTTLESSADGLFVSEEDMDKLMGVHTENETLKANLEAKATELSAALAGKDILAAEHQTAIDKLTAEKKASDDALAAANNTIASKDAEIATLKAKISGKPASEKGLIDNGGAQSESDKKHTWTETHIINKVTK